MQRTTFAIAIRAGRMHEGTWWRYAAAFYRLSILQKRRWMLGWVTCMALAVCAPIRFAVFIFINSLHSIVLSGWQADWLAGLVGPLIPPARAWEIQPNWNQRPRHTHTQRTGTHNASNGHRNKSIMSCVCGGNRVVAMQHTKPNSVYSFSMCWLLYNTHAAKQLFRF